MEGEVVGSRPTGCVCAAYQSKKEKERNNTDEMFENNMGTTNMSDHGC